WHGAAWTFVVWGGLHGGGLAVERWWDERRGRRRPAQEPPADGGMGDASPPADPSPEGPTTTGAPAVAPPVRVLDPVPARDRPLGPSTWLRRIVTFHVVCLGWVFFRSPSFGTALDVLGRLLEPASVALNPVVVVTVVLMLAAQLVPPRLVSG